MPSTSDPEAALDIVAMQLNDAAIALALLVLLRGADRGLSIPSVDGQTMTAESIEGQLTTLISAMLGRSAAVNEALGRG